MRAWVEGAALLVFLGLCLFVPAGSVAWPMGWAFLSVFGGFIVATFLLVDPALIRERASPGPGVKRSDAILASLGFLGLYPGTLIVAGLDAVRFSCSPAFPIAARVVALWGFVLGYAFALWAMRCNPFFATFVRIQTERGHHVVSEGPYAWVRHPGYAGALAAHLALPLALGSLWGVVPALVGTSFFVARTALEDRTLERELPGYRDYQRQVPWRLLPGAW